MGKLAPARWLIAPDVLRHGGLLFGTGSDGGFMCFYLVLSEVGFFGSVVLGFMLGRRGNSLDSFLFLMLLFC